MLCWLAMGTDSDHPDSKAHYLLVRSGGHRCAIPVEAAKLVTRVPTIYPLHSSGPRLLGLAQVAGEPVAVVDLHALLDPKGGTGGGHELTVVVSQPDGGSSLGLAVDEAFGVIAVADLQPREPTDPEWVAGRTSVDQRAVVVLDPEQLFVAPSAGWEG
jgi:chemotaxis signal transduction protein